MNIQIHNIITAVPFLEFSTRPVIINKNLDPIRPGVDPAVDIGLSVSDDLVTFLVI